MVLKKETMEQLNLLFTVPSQKAHGKAHGLSKIGVQCSLIFSRLQPSDSSLWPAELVTKLQLPYFFLENTPNTKHSTASCYVKHASFSQYYTYLIKTNKKVRNIAYLLRFFAHPNFELSLSIKRGRWNCANWRKDRQEGRSFWLFHSCGTWRIRMVRNQMGAYQTNIS